jgi:rhodanese-related sulfurtransferase
MSASKKRITRRLIKDMFMLLVAAGATGIVINLFHPHGFLLVSRPALEARKIVSISSEEAKIKYDAGAVFVDAREKDEYENARVTGAVSMPSLDAAAKKSGPDFSFLKKPEEIVIYCDGAACGASAALAELFQKRGYKRTIYIIERGFPEWESKGYPVERGNLNGK